MPRQAPRVEIEFTAGFAQFKQGIQQATQSLSRVGQAAVAAEQPLRRFTRALQQQPAITAAQRAAFRRLRGEMRRLGRQVQGLTRRMFSFRRIVGLLAGSGGIGLLVRRAAELGAGLVEEARALRLSVEDFQTLRDGLAEEGVQSTTFTRGFSQLQRAIGEADRGLATYTSAFDRLGVSIRRQNGSLKGAAELFRELVPALARADEATAASAGAALLGARAWREFAPAVLLGANALSAAEQRQRDIGVISTRAATELKAINQEFEDAVKAVRNFGAELVAGLGPDIRRVLEWLQELTLGLRERIPGAVNVVRQALRLWRQALLLVLAIKFGPRILTWVRAMRSLTVATRGAKNAMALFGRTAKAAFRGLAIFAIIEALVVLTRALLSLHRNLEEVGLQFRDLFRIAAAELVVSFVGAIGTAVLAFNGLIEVAKEVARGIADSFAALDLSALLLATLTGNQEQQARLVGEAITAGFEQVDIGAAYERGFGSTRGLEIIDDLQTAVRVKFGVSEAQARAAGQALKKTLDELIDSLRIFTRLEEEVSDEITESRPSVGAVQGRVAAQQARAELIRVEAGFTRLRNNATEVVRSLRVEFQRLITSLADGFGRVIGDLLTGIRSVRDALSDLVRAIQRAISREIGDRLAGSLLSRLGLGEDIPGRQYGGLGRGLTLVGEAGPELIDFRQPGRVYSNEALAAAIGRRGEVSVVYSPQIVGGTDQIEAALRRDKDELARVMPGLIAAALKGNPSLRRAVR